MLGFLAESLCYPIGRHLSAASSTGELASSVSIPQCLKIPGLLISLLLSREKANESFQQR